MAQITKAIRAGWGLTADLIPADIMKALDQGELLDRLAYSADLVRKSQAAVDPTIRRGYAALARATLTAQPRAVTERQSAALIAKAAGCPNSRQADALRREAQDLLERHPPAPRRAEAAAVAKAKAADPDLMVVFDADGQLLGVVPRAKVQPVNSRAADVAKARRQAGSPARRPATR